MGLGGDELMIEVMQRYRDLYPDWEIITASLQKHGDRQAQIDTIISVLESLKTTP